MAGGAVFQRYSTSAVQLQAVRLVTGVTGINGDHIAGLDTFCIAAGGLPIIMGIGGNLGEFQLQCGPLSGIGIISYGQRLCDFGNID